MYAKFLYHHETNDIQPQHHEGEKITFAKHVKDKK